MARGLVRTLLQWTEACHPCSDYWGFIILRGERKEKAYLVTFGRSYGAA
jgi:hypothetical protein